MSSNGIVFKESDTTFALTLILSLRGTRAKFIKFF